MRQDADAVVAESTNGFLALQSSTLAAVRADIPQAGVDLTNALQAFSAAEGLLNDEHSFLTSVLSVLPIVGPQVESRRLLLEAGQYLAFGNTYLVKGMESSSADPDIPFTDRIEIIRDHLQATIPQYKSALARLAKVDIAAVPVEYQGTFADWRVLFAAVVDDLGSVVELSNALAEAFGTDSFRRYLIVFQNHHELRPTGGFMGSFAIVDVQKGKILNVEIPSGGTYDLQGQLDTFVAPPLPLQLVNGRWEFQDANWFPDFAVSAQKIEWFYSHGRGRTVDGVIAVNASVLERLLRVLGPIEHEKYALLLKSDTVLTDLEQTIATGVDREANQPKAILSSLLSELVEVLQTVKPADALRLLTELHDGMNQKEVQMYFNDVKLQDTFRRYGWTGELAPLAPARDYLSVVVANLQGEKSDAVVEQTIEHQAVIASDGTVEDTVVVRRIHRGGNSFYAKPNISYLRLYVPEGAELLSAGGFTFPPESAFHVPESWNVADHDLQTYEHEEALHVETGTRISQEFGKTAFGNWVQTLPGETS